MDPLGVVPVDIVKQLHFHLFQIGEFPVSDKLRFDDLV
jgi:hypothetical protein